MTTAIRPSKCSIAKGCQVDASLSQCVHRAELGTTGRTQHRLPGDQGCAGRRRSVGYSPTGGDGCRCSGRAFGRPIRLYGCRAVPSRRHPRSAHGPPSRRQLDHSRPGDRTLRGRRRRLRGGRLDHGHQHHERRIRSGHAGRHAWADLDDQLGSRRNPRRVDGGRPIADRRTRRARVDKPRCSRRHRRCHGRVGARSTDRFAADGSCRSRAAVSLDTRTRHGPVAAGDSITVDRRALGIPESAVGVAGTLTTTGASGAGLPDGLPRRDATAAGVERQQRSSRVRIAPPASSSRSARGPVGLCRRRVDQHRLRRHRLHHRRHRRAEHRGSADRGGTPTGARHPLRQASTTAAIADVGEPFAGAHGRRASSRPSPRRTASDPDTRRSAPTGSSIADVRGQLARRASGGSRDDSAVGDGRRTCRRQHRRPVSLIVDVTAYLLAADAPNGPEVLPLGATVLTERRDRRHAPGVGRAERRPDRVVVGGVLGRRARCGRRRVDRVVGDTRRWRGVGAVQPGAPFLRADRNRDASSCRPTTGTVPCAAGSTPTE